MSADIEFFEATASVDAESPWPAAPGGEPAPGVGRSREWFRMAGTGLWVVANVLASWAPFTHLFAVRTGLRAPDQPEMIAEDGWGRITPREPIAIGGHEPRLGIALVAGAAVLLMLLALSLTRLGVHALGRRAQAILGTAAPAFLAGVALVIALELSSVASRYRSAGQQSLDAPAAHLLVGPMLWLALAATVAAATGSAVALWPARTSQPSPQAHGAHGADAGNDGAEAGAPSPDLELPTDAEFLDGTARSSGNAQGLEGTADSGFGDLTSAPPATEEYRYDEPVRRDR